MAEKKRQQYPIRLDISQQGPAKALPARKEPSMGDYVKQFAWMAALTSPFFGNAARSMLGSGGEMPPPPKGATIAPSMKPPRRERAPSVGSLGVNNIRDIFPDTSELSLRELASLSGSIGNMTGLAAKTPVAAKDLIGLELLNAAKTDFQNKAADAAAIRDTDERKNAKQSAYGEFIERLAMFNGVGLGVPGLLDVDGED